MTCQPSSLIFVVHQSICHSHPSAPFTFGLLLRLFHRGEYDSSSIYCIFKTKIYDIKTYYNHYKKSIHYLHYGKTKQNRTTNNNKKKQHLAFRNIVVISLMIKTCMYVMNGLRHLMNCLCLSEIYIEIALCKIPKLFPK